VVAVQKNSRVRIYIWWPEQARMTWQAFYAAMSALLYSFGDATTSRVNQKVFPFPLLNSKWAFEALVS
jgi:hypothetical protein